MSELSPHNPRLNSIAYLIQTGLGYCCERFFWEKFAVVPSDLIAARLGVSVEAVRAHRRRFEAGEFLCEQKEACLEGRLAR